MEQWEEKEVGQKTVVSFIAGLLIGGLLVWVFSGPEPEQQLPPQPLTPEQTEMKYQLKTEARCLSLKKVVATSVHANSIRSALVELEELGNKCN